MAERLCTLTFSQLNELCARLDEMSDAARNPSYRTDIQQARFAIQDLSNARFVVEELASKLIAIDYHDKNVMWNDVIDIGYELLAAIGKPVQP